MATKNTKSGQGKSAKSGQGKSGQGQKATTGAKVEKVTAVSKKAAANVKATEAASVKTHKGQGQAKASGQKPAGKGGQKPAAKGKAAAKAPAGGQQRGRASEYPLESTKVRATAGVELREGSFAAKISALAAKPILLNDLIEAAVAKRSDFFRSSAAADSADAARRSLTIRVRDLIRSEYLEVA